MVEKEKRAKGSMVKIMVISARLNKTGIYQEILTEEAKKMLNERIFDSVWYSHEPHREIFDAVCKIEAHNNPKILIEWGKKFGESIMKSIYRGSIVEGSIKRVLDKYARFHKLVYNTGTIVSEVIAENHVIVSYTEFEKDWEVFYYIALGWLLKYLELCTGKKISHKIIKKSWEGDNATSFEFSW